MRRSRNTSVKSGKKKKKKNHKNKKGLKVFTIAVTLLISTYISTVFFDIPIISDLRNIYIETAMTTGDHQWLATLIFPQRLIDRIMNNIVIGVDVVGGVEHNNKNEDKENSKYDNKSDSNKDMDTENDFEDILEQRHLKIGGKDYAGNEILVNDIEQRIIISEVKGATFKGKIALIDDPSRVFVGFSKYDSRGLTVIEMLEEHNAILGVNANGFSDYEGVGMGDEILGFSMSNGESKGELNNYYCTIAFDKNNNLIVGNVMDWDKYHIRDGGQFNPVLIANGNKYVENSAGWGMQPRTAIGQRADGVVMFLVIDGRQPTHSIGATVADCADILEEYGAINAACCDGGSSSIMGYDDEVATKCSSPMDEGRYLPNAFLVKKK